MAKALRTDLVSGGVWADFIRLRDRNRDARHIEKCLRCDVTYTVFLNVYDDVEDTVRRLREVLSRACPDHTPAYYTINEERPGIRPGIPPLA